LEEVSYVSPWDRNLWLPKRVPGQFVFLKKWGQSIWCQAPRSRPSNARARFHVHENGLGNLEMAASLASSPFQHVGWK
jgi:hypothetical protein